MDPQNQTPPPQTPVQPPQETPPQKRSLPKKFIIALVLIIVVFSGVMVLSVYRDNQSLTPSPRTAVTTPSPTPDPTADWDAYTSDNLGVTFKYPKGWYTNEESETIVILEKKVGVDGFAIAKKETYSSEYNDYLKYKISETKQLSNYYGNYSIQRLRDVQVDGSSGLMIFNKPEEIGANQPLKTIYVKKGSTYYKIWVSGRNQAEFDRNEKLFDLFISTFKFTDQNQILTDIEILEIKNGIFKRDGIPLNEMVFSVDEQGDATLASGSIGRKNESGGGKWFATKIDNNWIVVWTGNGLPACSEIAKYSLPKEFLNCY